MQGALGYREHGGNGENAVAPWSAYLRARKGCAKGAQSCPKVRNANKNQYTQALSGPTVSGSKGKPGTTQGENDA